MKNVFLFLMALSVVALYSGCASLSGFQTGKTVGKDAGEVFLTLNTNQSLDFDIDDDDEDDGEVIFFPNLELGGWYGVHEKVDLGLRMNTNLNILADVKYQFVGDESSEYAMAIGAGFGTFGFISSVGGLYNFQIPLYTSYHPSDNFDIYLTPRYIGQFASGLSDDDSSGYLSYYGGNAGFLWGTKTKFGLDIGYFGLDNGDGETTALLQIGLGVKFLIKPKD